MIARLIMTEAWKDLILTPGQFMKVESTVYIPTHCLKADSVQVTFEPIDRYHSILGKGNTYTRYYESGRVEKGELS